MFIEHRRRIRLDAALEAAKMDVLLSDSRRLIAEIDVLLEHSRELIDRQAVLHRQWEANAR